MFSLFWLDIFWRLYVDYDHLGLCAYCSSVANSVQIVLSPCSKFVIFTFEISNMKDFHIRVSIFSSTNCGHCQLKSMDVIGPRFLWLTPIMLLKPWIRRCLHRIRGKSTGIECTMGRGRERKGLAFNSRLLGDLCGYWSHSGVPCALEGIVLVAFMNWAAVRCANTTYIAAPALSIHAGAATCRPTHSQMALRPL